MDFYNDVPQDVSNIVRCWEYTESKFCGCLQHILLGTEFFYVLEKLWDFIRLYFTL